MRIKIVSWAAAFIFVFLSLTVFNITVIQGKKFRDLSDKNCIRLLSQDGSRGKILDRSGNVIVDNRLSYDVMVFPQPEKEMRELLMSASGILDTSIEELKAGLKNNFVSSSLPVVIAKNIDVKKAIALEELKPDLGNIIIQPKPLRYYPYGRLACHVIGYLGEIDRWRLTKLADYGYKTKDIVGFGGVEEKYDYYLRQEEGGLSVEVDNKGRFIRVLGFKPPRDGKDIQLTLDLKIQKIVEDSLQDRKGSVIIIDPTTGEILAMANNPNFNPSIFVRKTNPGAINGVFNNPEAPLINRAISGVYPPASVFKLVVASGALDTGKLSLSKTFFCPGSINVGKRQFSCWNTHGQQNLKGAIVHSCDVFFYRTGLLLGPEIMHDYALKFGFAKPTTIELPYEAGGFVPYPLWKKIYKFSRYSGIPLFAGKNWFDGDTANFAIGQGDLLVTPLQVARMMAVFANKGTLVNPYIVKSIGGSEVLGYKEKRAKVPIKESTLDYIREALREVVLNPAGTGNALSSLTVSLAGKTGTAQVAHGQPHAWFVSFFPFKNPKFVMCVFLENGGSGLASCILTRQIIEKMILEGLVSQVS